MHIILNAVATPGAMILVELALIIIIGLLVGQLAEKLHIPDVTGFLVAGLLLGPISELFGYRIISETHLESYHIISNVALGFIAFQVGNELWFGKLKKTGLKIIVITVIQAVFTIGIVITLLLAIGQPLPVALTLGAISAATAPAPIMMLVKKYKTKGDLTDTILPVVGLDDAVGVIFFGVLLSISVGLVSQSSSISFFEMLLGPLEEIGLSIVIGVLVGLVAGITLRRINDDNEIDEKHLNIVIIAVFLTTGLAMYFHASPILTPMIAGATVTNLINKRVYEVEEHTIIKFIPPLMILFFTMAGAELSFSVVLTAGVVGLGYVIGRSIGKYFGAMIGCKLTKSSKVVSKYLGISLLPQSGVAIGLASAAYIALIEPAPEIANIIKNVTLASVLIFALFGPLLVRISFQKAGEIRLQTSKM